MSLALGKWGLCCGILPVVEVCGSNTGQNIDRLSRGLVGTFRPKQQQYRQAWFTVGESLKAEKNIPCLFLSAPVYTNGQAYVTGHSSDRGCSSEEHLNKKQHVNRLVFAVQVSEPCSK